MFFLTSDNYSLSEPKDAHAAQTQNIEETNAINCTTDVR